MSSTGPGPRSPIHLPSRNTTTRWSSAFSDPQWLQVDLGANEYVCRIGLNWEAAYAKAYQIQISQDGTNWTDVYDAQVLRPLLA